MTKAEKDLLLKDLGARMIHGVIVNTPNGNGYLGTINLTIFGHELGVNIKATERETFPLDECKPYLRPLSTMTEEEEEELYSWEDYDLINWLDKEEICFKGITVSYEELTKLIDWLNANHFDYNGLIDKGLAIEVTEENNPYKE